MGKESRLKKNDLIGMGFLYNPDTGVITRYGKPLGAHKTQGYVRTSVNGKLIRGHILAWVLYYGEQPTSLIDHKKWG